MAYRMIYYSGASEADQATCEFIMRSSTDGVSWSGEWVTLDESPTYNTLGPCITILGDSTLLLAYNRVTRDPTVKLGVFYRISTDSGLTWGDPRQIVTSYANEAEGGPIIELADGRWCCPFWDASGGAFDAAVIFSADAGDSWADEVLIADGSADGLNYAEPNIIEYSAGNLLCLIREMDGNDIYMSRSVDNGANWTAPALAFAGRSASRMCLLSNGTIVSYFREDDGNEYPTIRTSADNGASWSAALHLLTDTPIYAHYGDVVELTGSRVGIAYGVGWNNANTDSAVFYTVLTFAELPS